jgi:hypothetical protein
MQFTDAPQIAHGLIQGYIGPARAAQKQIDKHGLVYGEKPSPWTISWEKAQKSAVALALRLRLSPQSRHDRKSKALQGPSAAAEPAAPWLPADGTLDD